MEEYIVTKELMSQQQLGISLAKSLNSNQMQLVHKPAKLVLTVSKQYLNFKIVNIFSFAELKILFNKNKRGLNLHHC